MEGGRIALIFSDCGIYFHRLDGFHTEPKQYYACSIGSALSVRRSLSHMIGMSLGIRFMLAAVGCGLRTIFSSLPKLQPLLKIISIRYLL